MQVELFSFSMEFDNGFHALLVMSSSVTIVQLSDIRIK